MTSKIIYFQKHTSPFEFLYGSYDFFTSQEDFIEGLYLGGNPSAARSLTEKIASVYEERLTQLSSFPAEKQNLYEEIIMNEINGYRRLMFYVSLYEEEVYQVEMEKRIYETLKPLTMFDRIFEEK